MILKLQKKWLAKKFLEIMRYLKLCIKETCCIIGFVISHLHIIVHTAQKTFSFAM